MEANIAHEQSAGEEHEFRKHLRIYIAVFVALLVGTMATVAAWKWGHFSTLKLTIAVALFIAVIKASLVAGFFMHLISERKAIYASLGATLIFFAGMMYLTVLSKDETPRGTEWWDTRSPGSGEMMPRK